MSNQKLIKVIGLFSITCIVLPLLFYIYFFRDQPISSNSADWNQFSGFLSAFISLANLIIIVALTYILNEQNQEREDDRQRQEEARSRPLLIFKEVSKDKWMVKNIGNGPALNVVLDVIHQGPGFGTSHQLYSLMSGEEYSFPTNYINTISFKCSYNDIFENRFDSTFEDQKMKITSVGSGHTNNPNGLIQSLNELKPKRDRVFT